ncbi:hypothetical protein ACEPAI_7006 [Sanghuangporus weigelae]
MASITPTAHATPNVHSQLRRASSHPSLPITTTTNGSKFKLTSPPHSRSSTSELGNIPGTYPRDPRIALEHLNDKTERTGMESTAANNGTILDAAREDWRYAVDVASQYLPGTVVGYAFPFGTTNPEEAETEKKLQAGGVGQQAPFAVVSDCDPRAPHSESSSNKHAPASKVKKDDDVQEVSPRQPQSQSSDLRKKAIETAALGAGVGTLGGAAYESSRSSAQPSSKVNPTSKDFSPASSESATLPEQSAKEHPAFATYAPAPVITDTSSEDTAKPTASASSGPSASSTSTSIWDERGRSDTQKALHPHRASGTDKNGADRKKAIQAAALGAGIGTVGGATYAHSHSPKDAADQVSPTGTAQPQVSGGKSEEFPVKDSEKSRGGDADAATSDGKLSEDQPAFVSYAPAPVITEDYTPDVPEDDDEEVPPTSSVRDEKATPSNAQKSVEKDDPDLPSDSRAKKGVEGAALGAGAGALGGAAYQHSRKNDKPKGDVAVAPAGYAETKDETKPTAKEVSVEPETQSHKTRDTQKSADQDISRSDDAKEKKRAEGAAVGAGAGLLGGAAYAHSRRSDQDPSVDSSTSISSPTAHFKERPSSPTAATDSQAQPAFKSAVPSTDTSGSKDTQKALSQSDSAVKKGAEGAAVGTGAAQASSKTSGSEPSQRQINPEAEGKDSTAPQESKSKKGFWVAALGASAGVLGGAALHYSRKNGEDDSGSRATEGSPVSQSKPSTDQSPGAGGDKDTKSTDKKGIAAAAATGAGVGAIGTGLASDKKSETDRIAENRKKEAEKREKDSVAASSSDKRGATRKEDKRDAKEAEKQHQAAKREKEVKKHERDVAASSGNKHAKRAEGTTEVTQPQQDEIVREDAKSKDQSKGSAAGAAGGAALGAGTGLAANSLRETKKHQPSDELTSTASHQAGTDSDKFSRHQAHPSIKAASNPPHRPGPIAHGAAGPFDVPKSGADSDFPLPSADASSTDVAPKAVDIDGSGKPSATDENKSDWKAHSKSERKTANTAAGVVTAGGAARQSGDKSRYHGSEGIQEKHEGGVLRSSTIERMRNGKNANGDGSNGNGNGNGNGHGKKEGFVKHIVEKVKDKLHHHDK